jgi:CheY-like chemotaxis protein
VRVLVVDDDASIVTLLERILAYLGHETEACTSASEAVQKATLGDFDCVMCDYMLSPFGPSGVDILAKIASHDCVRVLFTASYLTPEVSDAVRAGVVHYVLRKPATIAEIKSLLDAMKG